MKKLTIRPMHCVAKSILVIAATFAAFALEKTSAQIIVNIDFLEQRGDEPVATNYTGDGAAGGSGFNGLAADDNVPVEDDDNIIVAGTDLKDTLGAATTVGFSIGPIGADEENNGLNVLNDGYLFQDSGNNHLVTTPFTFTGLGDATSATLYFYTSANPGVVDSFTVPGATRTTFAPTGIFTTSNTIEFTNVPVTAGSIAGTFNSFGILSGVTLAYTPPAAAAVPEPSSWTLVAIGVSALIGTTCLRRKA